MVKVKICGITVAQDALAAVEYGADAVGFIFYPRSPRWIEPERARKIIEKLPPFVTAVGVFVNEDPEVIRQTMLTSGAGVVQLHGNEPPQACSVWPQTIKAFRIRDAADGDAVEQIETRIRRYSAVTAAYLLDGYSEKEYGGTGKSFDWELARGVVNLCNSGYSGNSVQAGRAMRMILSGGLTPDNVGEAVRTVAPYAVDTSSGVEILKGIKDHAKMKLFIERAKGAMPCRY
jgi:phosphoribosylanthranilate isomerase